MDKVSKQLSLTPYMDEGVSPDGLPTIKTIQRSANRDAD
jgi:hypothetical protein